VAERRRRVLGAVLAVAIGLAASGLAGISAGAATGGGASATLRLGYFPNVTHAPALVGVQGGLFTQALGPNVNLKLSTFNAGPAAVEALLSNSIDASYVGPNPAINAFIQSSNPTARCGSSPARRRVARSWSSSRRSRAWPD
jgi:NitT/TauT family transport system substrate-binding protein